MLKFQTILERNQGKIITIVFKNSFKMAGEILDNNGELLFLHDFRSDKKTFIALAEIQEFFFDEQQVPKNKIKMEEKRGGYISGKNG
mgnify:CR=1 FL=1